MPPRFFFDEIFLPLELAPTAEPPDELPSSDESSRCSAAASAAALLWLVLGMVSLRALTVVIDLICPVVGCDLERRYVRLDVVQFGLPREVNKCSFGAAAAADLLLLLLLRTPTVIDCSCCLVVVCCVVLLLERPVWWWVCLDDCCCELCPTSGGATELAESERSKAKDFLVL